MKGIREAAFGSDKEPEKPKDSLWPSYKPYKPKDPYRYDGMYNPPDLDNDFDDFGTYKSPQSSWQKEKDEIKLIITITKKELGKAGNEYHPNYKWEKKLAETERLALIKLEKLAPNYKQKYHKKSLWCDEMYDETEVNISLIPIKN